MTLLTGSVKITIGLALIMLIGIVSQFNAATHDDPVHAHHEQRWILVLSFIAKLYVSDALASNIQYSGSYDN